MNQVLLTDYQKRLEIAKAKIEVLEMVLERLEKAKEEQLKRGELERVYHVKRELSVQKVFIICYCIQLKQRIKEDWQRLEPKPEDYGYNAEKNSWDSGHDAVSFRIMHNRWEQLEPFKTTENDPT